MNSTKDGVLAVGLIQGWVTNRSCPVENDDPNVPEDQKVRPGDSSYITQIAPTLSSMDMRLTTMP